MKIIMYRVIYITVAIAFILCGGGKVNGQKVEPLRIGDRVPEIQFEMVNYTGKELKLSEIKNKLIILDFWATWCGSCVEALPKLQSLQAKLSKNLQIILVNSKGTGDTKDKIFQFIKRREKVQGKKFSLGTSINDNVALSLFPHIEIPHYVWISKDGIVQSITESDQVTEENIQKVIKGETVNLSQKRDVFSDKISLYDDEVLTVDDNLAHFSFLRKGKIEGWSSRSQTRSIKPKGSKFSETRGLIMRNVPLMEMYETLIGLKRDYPDLNHNWKRVKINMSDSSGLIFNPDRYTLQEWEQDNLYTYDLVVPEEESQNLFEIALNDFNRYSPYCAIIEKRNEKCLLLVLTDTSRVTARHKGSIEANVEKGVQTIKNATPEFVVRCINLGAPFRLPVIDFTGNSSILIDLNLDMKNETVETLKAKLKIYGLDLVESAMELPMFVITKKVENK